MDDSTAAGAYRSLLAELADTATELAAAERQRRADLQARFRLLDARLHAAAELQAYVLRVVRAWWERAHSEVLWRDVRWLGRDEFPAAAGDMAAADLVDPEQELAERLVALELARRRWPWEVFSR